LAHQLAESRLENPEMKTCRCSCWIPLSLTACFLIASSPAKANPPSAPTLVSVSPATGAQGASVAVTLTGADFEAGATVAVDDPQINVAGVTVVNSTQINATLNITVLDTLEAGQVGDSNRSLFHGERDRDSQ
jgi:IPT/TIG domain